MANTFKFGNGNWASKKEAVLAYNDENSNFKPLPFTFDRASSATVVNKQGLIETVGTDEPRIDFLNNSKGHLLLEPQRQNVITYSEFDSASPTNWQTGFGTGTFSYDLVSYKSRPALKQRQQTEGRSYKAQNVTVSTSTTYTFSFYIDKENSLNINDNDVVCAIISSDDIGFSSRNYGDADENNRINFTFTTNTDTDIQIRIGLGASGNEQGDKTLIFSMPQLEAGSYPTSYIPTQGSAVTRSAETMPTYLDITPLNIGNSYTLFLDANLNVNESNKVFLQLITSSSQTSFTVRNNIGGVRAYNQIDSNYPVSGIISSNNKFVIRVDGNSYKIFTQGTSLSGTLTTQRDLGYLNFIGNNTELKINNFTIDNTALSDAECQALTS